MHSSNKTQGEPRRANLLPRLFRKKGVQRLEHFTLNYICSFQTLWPVKEAVQVRQRNSFYC